MRSRKKEFSLVTVSQRRYPNLEGGLGDDRFPVDAVSLNVLMLSPRANAMPCFLAKVQVLIRTVIDSYLAVEDNSDKGTSILGSFRLRASYIYA